jgi:hypothetical protein
LSRRITISASNKLNDKQKANSSTCHQGLKVTIEASEHVNGGLTEGDQKCKEVLSPGEQTTILLEGRVNINKVSTCQKLHDYSKVMIGLIPSSISVPLTPTVGGRDDMYSVEWV